MSSLITMEEARRVAEEAWGKSKNREGVVRRKCVSCFEKWNSEGQKSEEKPPVFPPDFEEPCPYCGGKLSEPRIPF